MDSSIASPQSEMAHKTKVIQFLGRTTPIILQNDNGPCPLLAIYNVLLLKNNLNLSPDITEVSQEKLLSLLAERLIDSNSSVNDKDAGYVENQQQNIADAIDLLPRLATGIDVNIKFRRIDDFEFTCECAIFDLLDIPLYHGWIVDPQDHDTANAIGSKSYNTLMGELVALDAQNIDTGLKKSSEDDDVDFAAATTATLGVPSPCLSIGRSFDDSPPITDHHTARIGDIEEEAELLKALQLSEAGNATSLVKTDGLNSLGEIANLKSPEPVVLNKTSEGNAIETRPILQHEALISTEELVSNNNEISGDGNPNSSQLASRIAVSSSLKIDQETPTQDLGNAKLLAENEKPPLESGQVSSSACENPEHLSGGMNGVQGTATVAGDGNSAEPNQVGCDAFDSSSSSIPSAVSGSSRCRQHETDEPETFSPSIDGDELIYEGEDCILESATTSYQSREPMYEGEVVLAEQVNGGSKDVAETIVKDEITQKEGELVRNFLKNSASQLTIFGLFSLQEGLKERELCVFFRNNHFNTMFKFEGELYILATDQGFINQPDLVWEKFNEVNGDTIYVTGNFKEFKVEDNANTTWDQQNAMASTADFLANMDNSGQGHPTFNSDLQLAIALQQQEFEQQQQAPQRNQNPQQQPAVNGGSRLITGPQAQYLLVLCSFKEQLQQHVRVHAVEAVMACREIEQNLQLLTGATLGEGTGATMSDDEDELQMDFSLDQSGGDAHDLMSMGFGLPTESERSLMERVRQELKIELKQGFRSRIEDVREEILRKRRAGKLPGDTTTVLKNWWQQHSKWPYPTEDDKAKLVEETGLQLKQINNWFINQRKRNWHSNSQSVTSLKSKRKR